MTADDDTLKILGGLIVIIAGALWLVSKTYSGLIDQLRMQNAAQQKQINLQNKELCDLKLKTESIQASTKTMWNFQMRRAQVEALKLEKTMAPVVLNAPVVISPVISADSIKIDVIPQAIFAILAPKGKVLAEYYNSLPPDTDDNTVMLGIAEHFDEWIVKNICEPYELLHGECLRWALAIAKYVATKENV